MIWVVITMSLIAFSSSVLLRQKQRRELLSFSASGCCRGLFADGGPGCAAARLLEVIDFVYGRIFQHKAYFAVKHLQSHASASAAKSA